VLSLRLDTRRNPYKGRKGGDPRIRLGNNSDQPRLKIPASERTYREYTTQEGKYIYPTSYRDQYFGDRNHIYTQYDKQDHYKIGDHNKWKSEHYCPSIYTYLRRLFPDQVNKEGLSRKSTPNISRQVSQAPTRPSTPPPSYQPSAESITFALAANFDILDYTFL
jgi:hypothetical protein